jgi:hypothetical protein
MPLLTELGFPQPGRATKMAPRWGWGALAAPRFHLPAPSCTGLIFTGVEPAASGGPCPSSVRSGIFVACEPGNIRSPVGAGYAAPDGARVFSGLAVLQRWRPAGAEPVRAGVRSDALPISLVPSGVRPAASRCPAVQPKGAERQSLPWAVSQLRQERNLCSPRTRKHPKPRWGGICRS